MSNEKFKKVLYHINDFLVFFLIVSFVVTCCMTLFLRTLAVSMGIEFTPENVETAAKITLVNVIVLTLILTLCDVIRRKITVERPTKKIVNAGRKIMKGDFSARIEKTNLIDLNYGFSEIADCFNKMAEELSSTETLRTDFIANVSHEIKTPLSVMSNYATLLQEPNLTEKKRIDYARVIGASSRRLSNLVTNILKLNKLENQQIAPKYEKYDLSEQLCECLLQFEDAWESKKLNIETDIDDEVTVESDREMMSLVWNNLISNAIKFTEEGGTISVSVKESEHHATVIVSDTGCGISSEVGSHLFDKFYQGDTSHSTEGNGLGLALVKRVVDLTNSTISVESELGKGTAFTIRMRK